MPKFMRAPSVRARQRGFLDFSFPELAITFSIALVVLGPKKLPGLVRQVGRWVGRARHMASQFREQLEQEVNSISEVKPVTRPAAPDVGPPAPGSPAAADVHGDIHDETHSDTAGTEATGVVDDGTSQVSSEADTHAGGTSSEASGETGDPVEAPPGSDVHPETQIYFALNGTEPEVVAQNPFAPPPEVTAVQAGPEPVAAVAEAPPAPGAAVAGNGHAPAAPAAGSGESATVAVVFPHDHDHG